jgi:hypothetical protein
MFLQASDGKDNQDRLQQGHGIHKMIGMGRNNMQLLIIYKFNTSVFVFTQSLPAL